MCVRLDGCWLLIYYIKPIYGVGVRGVDVNGVEVVVGGWKWLWFKGEFCEIRIKKEGLLKVGVRKMGVVREITSVWGLLKGWGCHKFWVTI